MEILESTKRKRHVRSHRKSKDGCKLCKSRRVKCDETKPECLRCKKMGVACIYVPPKTWLFEIDQPAARNDGSGSLCRTLAGTAGSGADSVDSRAFSFFRHQTAPRFIWTSPVSKQFFEQFIPQVAVSEPVIWDVVVAMAMKHEEYASVDQVEATRCRRTALAKYTKAVSNLAKPRLEAQPDVAALGAILLGAFFNMAEDSLTTGVEHMIHGSRILQESCRSEPTSDQAYLRAFISSMLLEVALVTAAYSRPPESATCMITSTEQQPQLPSQFADLVQAKRLLYEIFRYRAYLMTQRLRSKEASQMASTELLLLKWYDLVGQFKTSHPPNSPEARAASHMMFQSKMWCMSLSPACSAFLSQCQIEVQSVDLTNRESIRVTASLPLGPYPSLQKGSYVKEHGLDIWPHVSAISTSQTGTLVAVTI